ncbi:hypothetical protein BHE74_00049730 [Ensete ventricosum]|nr:hypothetical protein BHE74_00049730 [Ensete ventricosum]RZS18548.1 hypothetical protein BHM03_00050826 [Ensete ventricosum]
MLQQPWHPRSPAPQTLPQTQRLRMLRVPRRPKAPLLPADKRQILVTALFFKSLLPSGACNHRCRLHPSKQTHSQRRASATHILFARYCPFLSAFSIVPATVVGQPFFLNTLTRLLPFLCFTSQSLPAPSVSLRPAASHPYSQPASLIIAGCFLFFSTCTSSALLSMKRQPIIILWRPFFGTCLPQTGLETCLIPVSPPLLASEAPASSSSPCPRRFR